MESNYVTYFPASTSTSTNGQIFLNENKSSDNIQCLNLFGDEDWSLQFGKGIETMEKKCQEDDHDLDLELRLGHHDPLKQ